MPPDQNASHRVSTWLFRFPVIILFPSVMIVFHDFRLLHVRQVIDHTLSAKSLWLSLMSINDQR